MKTKEKSKFWKIVAELAIIFATANVLFYVSKTYNPSLGNLIFSLLALVGAIWLKIYHSE